MYRSKFNLIIENVYANMYYTLTESRRFPVSVRNADFKRLENNIKVTTPGYREAALDLFNKFNTDPESVGFTPFGVNIRNPHGTWYKLHLKIPGASADYRVLGFAPNKAPGLIIWDWIGTHEEYNNIWREIAKGLPGDFYLDKAGNLGKLEPGMSKAVDAAIDARARNLPMSQGEIEAQANRAAAAQKRSLKQQRISLTRAMQRQAMQQPET